MRLFLAINPSNDVRRELHAAAVALRESAPELAWIPEPRLHFTLKFLGEQPDDRLDDFQAALAHVASQHRELLMTLGGVGAFPNFRRARVIWIGVTNEPRLELLHHDIELAFQELGLDVEGRPFRPHVTLARVDTPLPVERARELSRAARTTDYQTQFIVHSVDLMRSDLSATGPTYTTLISAALRPG